MTDMQTNPVRQEHDRDGPYIDAEDGFEQCAIIAEQRKAFVHEFMCTDIRRCSTTWRKWSNQLHDLKDSVNRRQGGEEAA